MMVSRGNQILRNLHRSRGIRSVSTINLTTLKPYDFVEHMKQNGMRRCYFAFDPISQKPISSNPEVLQSVTSYLEKDKVNFLGHEGLFFEVGRRSGALLSAFVWRSNRGQACGGIRLWQYDTLKDYIHDGLRLSYGMGTKSALAGLWAGGGKGIIAAPKPDLIHDEEYRKHMFMDYGDFLSSLNGCYVGAEDAGVVVSDLDNVHSRTRYVTCIGEEFGGSGNPSIATGKGILCAIEAALDFKKMGNVKDKSIVVQGTGNVARIIINGLIKRQAGRILATDCDEKQLEIAEEMFKKKGAGILELRQVQRNDNSTLSEECDVLSPNALGNVLNETTIPTINAKIVCGAANNQLGKPADNKLLQDRGITYVVDFLANRMGIVNCADEAYGRLDNDPSMTRHFHPNWDKSIWCMTQQVLQTAIDKDITPVEAAIKIAEKLSLEEHPIWPSRGRQIINSLIANKWHNSW